jgi:hypothetical protein
MSPALPRCCAHGFSAQGVGRTAGARQDGEPPEEVEARLADLRERIYSIRHSVKINRNILI